MIHWMFGSASSAARTHAAVTPLVRLRARRPHRRAAASVEQFELDAGRVDGAAHQAAQRVYFTDQMALGGSADGRVARHVGHGFARQRAQTDAAAQPRRRPRRLDAGMPGADDDDI